MKTNPIETAGEAMENQRADVQLAAIKGTSDIVSAYLQNNAGASLADAKDLLATVGQQFQAFITTSPVSPRGTKRAGAPADDSRARQALGVAMKEVTGGKTEPKGVTPVPTTVNTATPRKGKGKKIKAKGVGQFAEIVEQFEDFEDAGLTPMVKVEDSVTPDYIVCLHTGNKFKMMKGHLRQIGYTDTKDQTVLDRYREFWKLSKDYPLVAPNYSKKRRKIADGTITGRKPGAKTILTRAGDLKTKRERQDYLVSTTVFPNYIISLIDSSKQKHLEMHVESKGMKWEDYLTKFELPTNYPKEAASVAAGQNQMRERQGIDQPKRTGTGG